MFAVNFQNVGESTSISIQDLFPGTTEGLSAGTGSTGDQIQIYDSVTGGYTTYYLFYSPMAIFASKNYKWVDTAANIATITFSNGSVFWYRKRGEGDVTITVSGAVSLEPSQNITIVPGWNMIANAFPANFNPNSLGTSYWEASGAAAGTGSTGDQIQIYDSTTGGYTTYYLFYSPMALFAAKNYKWVDASANVIDSSAELMSIGKGAWYRHRGSGFTLTIPTPMN